MTGDEPPSSTPTQPPSAPPSTSASAELGTPTPSETVKVVEAEIAPILEKLPKPERTQILHKIEESLTAFIATNVGTPKLDPETVKILTATVQADNENKFKYLTQKQTDAAAHQARQHELNMSRHRDGMSILKPCTFAAILMVLGLVGSGIAFIAYGREAVGSSIISGTVGLFFGFLGGFGISKTFGQD